MTKNELAERVAKKVGLTKRSSFEAVSTVFGLIRDSLAKGDKVVISGFGTFKIRSRTTRTGRNPQTGEAIKITGHKLPGFTAGKTLRRLVK